MVPIDDRRDKPETLLWNGRRGGAEKVFYMNGTESARHFKLFTESD